MRRTILIIASTGAVTFITLLLLSFIAPTMIERWARAAIAVEVQARVEKRLDTFEQATLFRAAERALGRNSQKLEEVRAAVRRQVPVVVRGAVEQLINPDCPCRATAKAAYRQYVEGRISALDNVNAKLSALVQAKYVEVTSALLREFRIFTGANAAVFMILGAVAWLKPRASLQLLAPTIVLIGAALFVGTTYLLAQNWLHTIFLGDYVGWMYLPYLGFAVLGLADVVFNRARVSTHLVNAVS